MQKYLRKVVKGEAFCPTVSIPLRTIKGILKDLEVRNVMKFVGLHDLMDF